MPCEKHHRQLVVLSAFFCLLVVQVRGETAIRPLLPLSPLAKFVPDLGKLGLYYGINLREHVGLSFRTKASSPRKARRKLRQQSDSRHAEFEQIGQDVEAWAEALLAESGRDGSFLLPGSDWKQIECNKALKHIFNPDGSALQFVKWMPDSRGKHADSNDSKLHPIMKLYAVIDAPFDLVCRYLSQEHRYKEYNSLLIDQKDVEELSPHSKICWSQTKKLLFIHPRDFVTYCCHKWRKDGTQVILNQACEHPSYTNDTNGLRAFGLRGATFISRHPDRPQEQTNIILLAHCNCGNDVPEWAVRAAVGVLAPIKPFEIVHRINVGVHKAKEQLQQLENHNNKKHRTREGDRSGRPAGMAQMGYACFWPNGGGLVEQ